MSEPNRICLSCNQYSGPQARFCGHCGLPFAAAAFVEPGAAPATQFFGTSRLGTASWPDLKRVIEFYCLLLAICLASGIAHSFVKNPKIDFCFWAAWGVATAVFAALDWKSVARAFRPRKPKAKTLLELAAVTLFTVSFLVLYFAAFHFFNFPLQELTLGYTRAHWPRWAIFGMIAVLPGIFEEIAYRGVIQTKLTEILSVREALVIQAALFSVMHLSPLIFVSHFVMGLLFGWTRLRSGHIYYGMLLHAGWNAACVLEELARLP